MSNDYYTRQNDYLNGTIARGDSVQNDLQAVEGGFDKLPTPTTGGFSSPVLVGNATASNHAITKAQTQDLIDLAGGFSDITGRKNKIINGNFDIWQRGTTGSFTGTSGYTADRWRFDTNSSDTFNYARISYVTASTQYCFGITLISSGLSGVNDFRQKIEGVNTLSGNVTVNFTALSTTSESISIYVSQNFGSGGSATVNTTLTSVQLTPNMARYAVTFTLPSISGKTLGTGHRIDFTFRFNNNSSIYRLSEVQLEQGSVATDFESRFAAEEQMLCRRYYRGPMGTGMIGGVGSVDSCWVGTSFDLPMYTAPSVTLVAQPSIKQVGGPVVTASGAAISSVVSDSRGIGFNVNGFAGLTAGYPVVVQNNFIALDAEI